MTMGGNRLEILLTARDQASRQITGVTRKLSDMQGELRRASMMMAGGAAVLGGGLLFAMRAERQQELAVATLSQALKTIGIDYADVRDEVESTTAALQRKTNFGDEEQIQALQALVSIGGDYEQALRVLPSALDLAVGAQTDLKAASLLLGKALAGETGSLSRYGILIKEGATEAEILAAIMGKYPDLAEAAADPIIQLKNAFGDLAERLQIRDAFELLAVALGGLSRVMGLLPPSVMRSLGLALTAAFAILLSGALVLAIAAAIPAIVGLTVVLGGLTLSAGGIALVALAIAGLVVGVSMLVMHWDKVWRAITIAFEAVSDFIVGIIDSKWAWLLPGGVIAKALLEIGRHWDEIWGAIQATAETVWEAIKTVFNASFGWIMKTGAFATAITFIGELWDTVWGAVQTTASTIWSGIAGFFDWMGEDGSIVGAIRFIGTLWDTVWGAVKTVASAIWNGIEGAFSWLFEDGPLVTAIQFLGSLWDTVWTGMSGAIKAPINAIISGLNVLIDGVNLIKIPSIGVGKWSTPGFDINIPNIPPLAQGGIVTKPTLAMIGEAGPEAVIPLSSGMGRGGAPVTVNVHMPPSSVVFLQDEMSLRRLGTLVTRLVREELRGQAGFA